jgi:hypothetical protein
MKNKTKEQPIEYEKERINDYLNTRHRLFHMRNPRGLDFLPCEFSMEGTVFGSQYKPEPTGRINRRILYVNLLKTQDHWCGATSDIEIWSYYLRFEEDGQLLHEMVSNAVSRIAKDEISPGLEKLLSSSEEAGFRVVSPKAEMIWVRDNHAEFVPIENLPSLRVKAKYNRETR